MITTYPIQANKQAFSIFISVLFFFLCFSIPLIIFIHFFNSERPNDQFIAIIICVVLVLIAILVYFTSKWSLASISYSCTKYELILRGGVISKYEKNLPFSRLQHIIISQSFIGRLFGIATLQIQTAGMQSQTAATEGQQIIGPEIPALFLEDAQKLRNELLIEINNTDKREI